MDGLFADSKAVSPPPPPKPPAVNEVSKVRESKAVRQSYPRVAAGGRGFSTGVNPGMNLPGVMSPEVLQDPAVQNLLTSYGVNRDARDAAVANASPNMFVTNPSAFQRHPVLAGLLEHGLEGLAFTKGGDTVGESLSNVAQGYLGAQAARAEKYNNQLMLPFQEASSIAGLKGEAARQQFEASQAARDQALVKHYADMDDTRRMYDEGMLHIRQEQDAAREQMNHIRLLADKRFSGLSDKDSAEFNDTVAKYGGLRKVPDDVFEEYARRGATNLFNQQEAGKNKRAGMAAAAHITGAKISASSRPGANHEYADAKATWDQTNRDIAKFDAQVSRTGGFGVLNPETGQRMKRGDIATYRKNLTDKRDQAKQTMDRTASMQEGMATPGSGMTQPDNPPAGAKVRDYTQLRK